MSHSHTRIELYGVALARGYVSSEGHHMSGVATPADVLQLKKRGWIEDRIREVEVRMDKC